MLSDIMCNCNDYMNIFTDIFLKIGYYIRDHFGYNALYLYNNIIAIILGVIIFAIIYIIIPSISVFILVCFCSFCFEICEKITNTYILLRNLLFGIKNDIYLLIDGLFVTIVFIYCIRPLLFNY